MTRLSQNRTKAVTQKVALSMQLTRDKHFSVLITVTRDNLGAFNRTGSTGSRTKMLRSVEGLYSKYRTEYNRENKLITYSVEPFFELVSVHRASQCKLPKFSADCLVAVESPPATYRTHYELHATG